MVATWQERAQKLWAAAVQPEAVTGWLQIAKAVIAGTVAWWLSRDVLDSQMPFLAPWTALLTVHVTVYRSVSRGLQTLVASILGVALSFVIGAWLGVSVGTFALALAVGMVLALVPWIRDEGVAIATTAIFVLGAGFGQQQPLLLDRILEIGLGVAVGIAVNLLIIPPLREKQAARYVDSINRRMGGVLVDMADEFATAWDTERADAWVEETRSMSRELASAWQEVHFARESERGNPRTRRAGALLRRHRGTPADDAEEASYEEILARVEEGISHLRHLSRTLREGAYAEGEWDDRFRQRWVAIVRDAGRSIADPDAEVEPIADRLSGLALDLADNTELPRCSWPLYGSLIASMLHIAVIVDDVASARAARETPSTS
ncbi:MAG: FUSC family protein [Brachybacterium tyrofermentans]|uniref:FUSC family protein n=1 Tax=Brachybacterium tyrofermentans TaxID=47848 RepID=UPI00186826EF|nr:aromatic acid exporter family protein [Brachybacterium tyrofermentans]